MPSRATITKTHAVRYRSPSRAGMSQILDLACAVTGFNRDYARWALRLAPSRGQAAVPRPPEYDAKVVVAGERMCGGWAVSLITG